MSIRIEVPAGGPLFEGHFPGRPILPGVAELAMVVRALAPAEGPDAVRAIPFLRFRGLVLPGDTLAVSARPSAAGAVRFDLWRGDGIVANGGIHFGVADQTEDLGTAAALHPPHGLPRLDELVPHRPPMRFVESVLDETEVGVTCLARVPVDCALVSRNTTPTWVAIEAAAQTAAVWEAVRRWRGGATLQPRIGYLVSVRDVTLHRETIPADVDLFASIRLVARAGALSTYTIEVVTEGAIALRGMIGTYLSG